VECLLLEVVTRKTTISPDVGLVGINIWEEHITSIFRVGRISELGTASTVTSN
jgi:hypothetical protein